MGSKPSFIINVHVARLLFCRAGLQAVSVRYSHRILLYMSTSIWNYRLHKVNIRFWNNKIGCIYQHVITLKVLTSDQELHSHELIFKPQKSNKQVKESKLFYILKENNVSSVLLEISYVYTNKYNILTWKHIYSLPPAHTEFYANDTKLYTLFCNKLFFPCNNCRDFATSVSKDTAS